MIFAEEAENIGIGGPGVIDGNGRNFVCGLKEEERNVKRSGREDCPTENIHFTHCNFEAYISDTELESDVEPTVLKLEMVSGITMTDTTFRNMTVGQQTDPDVVMIHNKLGN